MNWINGRKISDKQEYDKIKASYFALQALQTDLTNAELVEQQSQRERLSTNQAR
jgi:hypothetical protein